MSRSTANGARQTSAAAALISSLASRCAHIVASPGSRSTPLVLAADAHPDIVLSMVLDERAAAFIALGIARATASPVALICTSGSAGAHYLPALCEARQSRIPLIAITADRPLELHGCGAPQTMPQSGLYGAHVVGARDLADVSPEQASNVGRWALATATAERGGPVHLNFALRKPLWAPGPVLDSLYTVQTAHSGDNDILNEQSGYISSALDKIRASIAGKARGVVVCGADTSRQEADSAELFANHMQWPVFAAPTAAARWLNGKSTIAAHQSIVRSGNVNPPDVVVQLGRAPLCPQLLGWLGAASTRVLLDRAGDRHDPLRTGATLVSANPVSALELMVSGTKSADSDWLDWWRREQAKAEAAIAVADEYNWEGAVIRAVVAALPDEHTLHVAASMPIRDMNSFCGPSRPLRVHANRGVNGIDGLIATTAGEALAAGAATLICGDLAFLHDVSGLMAAGALGVRLDVVVINNDGGGIFAHLPISKHRSSFDKLFRTAQPTRIAPLVEACRGTYLQTHEILELRCALSAPSRGVRVVEHVVDRHLSFAARNRVWERVASNVTDPSNASIADQRRSA